MESAGGLGGAAWAWGLVGPRLCWAGCRLLAAAPWKTPGPWPALQGSCSDLVSPLVKGPGWNGCDGWRVQSSPGPDLLLALMPGARVHGTEKSLSVQRL